MQSKSFGSMVTLIVDDDEVTRRMLTTQLGARYDRVLQAADGDEALKICRSQKIDLIISDWLMPNMSGVEFCRALRADPPEHFMFFMMLTSLQEKDRLYQAFDAGADDYLTKPWDAAELRARLTAAERIIGLERVRTRNIRLGNRLNVRLSKSYQRLAVVARTDPLTGLLNRRESDAQIEQALNTAAMTGDPVSIAMIDVDHFKQVNDLHGHKAGDDVLKALARVLQSTMDENASCFRMGGDEFVVLMPATDARRAAEAIARFRTSVGLAETFRRYAQTGLGVSVGVTTVTQAGITPDQAIGAADAALYADKSRHGVAKFPRTASA